LSNLSFQRCISPSGRGAGHHIWSSRTCKIDDVNVVRPKRIKKAKNKRPKDRSQDLTGSADLFNECALGHFFTLTFPEYIWETSRHLLLGDLAIHLARGIRLPTVFIRRVDPILDRLDHPLAKRPATAAPVTPGLFMSLTNSSTPYRSSSSRVDNPRSHSLIFTGLWPVHRGSPGI
jgi:hypothetical protein